MNPPFPYCGGKRRQAQGIIKYFPKDFDTYFEPFLGGGAVLLELQPRKAIVSDINPQIIGTFRTIRSELGELVRTLDSFENTELEYYRLRNMDRDDNFDGIPDSFQAARFIALSKMGFGSNARFNLQGQINSPYSQRPERKLYNKEDLLEIHKYLIKNDVAFVLYDYEKVLDELPMEEDFVYVDPPYYGHHYNYFGKRWSEDDHVRLKEALDRLTIKGVKWLQTNSNTEFIANLYSNYELIPVEVTREFGRYKGEKSQKELIIKNY